LELGSARREPREYRQDERELELESAQNENKSTKNSFVNTSKINRLEAALACHA